MVPDPCGSFCANTYRRSGDLRAVALAYTCAAVARVRVVMAKQACFARDTSEFRNAMQLDSGPHVASNGAILTPFTSIRLLDVVVHSWPGIKRCFLSVLVPIL